METESTIGKLTAQRRTGSGKGTSRKLRARGLVPAVLYGHGQENITLVLDPAALKLALDPQKQQNTFIELTVEGDGQAERHTVMLKDYQINAMSQKLQHADFVRVNAGEHIEIDVPLVLEGKPEGVKLGGVLHQVFRDLPISCTPDRIPSRLTADVSALQLNQSLAVEDLALPEGIIIRLPSNQTVALVMTPKKEKATAEEEAAAAAAAEGAAPAEGAPKEEAAAEKKGA